MPWSLGDIVAKLGGELRGDPQQVIDRIATLERAAPGSITFLANPRYATKLAATRAKSAAAN